MKDNVLQKSGDKQLFAEYYKAAIESHFGDRSISDKEDSPMAHPLRAL
ncbi:MAG: hypothetical protein P8M78_14930 [Myxococcota bacterium]|nr:hypothetical protein [Myxococcota bacterium]